MALCGSRKYPPPPVEFPMTFLGVDMDLIWNRTIAHQKLFIARMFIFFSPISNCLAGTLGVTSGTSTPPE